PGQDAIGKAISLDFGRNDVFRTVVGVVRNTKQAFDDEVQPAIYVPIRRLTVPILLRNLTFVARTAGAPAAIVPAIRESIRVVDASLPFDRIRTLEELRAASVISGRLTGLLKVDAASGSRRAPSSATPDRTTTGIRAIAGSARCARRNVHPSMIGIRKSSRMACASPPPCR